MPDPQYIMPLLPGEPFMLQPVDNPQMPGAIGPYRANDFIQDQETGITRSTEEGGSNIYLPVISQQGDTLSTLDNEGNAGEWMVIPIPDNTMPDDGADAGSLSSAQAQVMANVKDAVT